MDFILLLILALNLLGIYFIIGLIESIEDRVADIQRHAIRANERRKTKGVYK
jgi:hypothetical protein